MSVSKIENIGIITINNSLGKNTLITEFDKALNSLIATEGLIIDLRNTVSGGNSYVARGIMGRIWNWNYRFIIKWRFVVLGHGNKFKR